VTIDSPYEALEFERHVIRANARALEKDEEGWPIIRGHPVCSEMRIRPRFYPQNGGRFYAETVDERDPERCGCVCPALVASL